MQNNIPFKKLGAAFAGILLFHGIATAAVVTDYADINYWVGTGSKQAALVIAWSDGVAPVSLAWGFRWDGVATGWDMLNVIAAADSRLGLVVHPSFNAIFGLYYDVTGNNTGFVAGTPGDLGGPEDGTANNIGDHYQEGWYSGYWAYSIYGGSFDYDVYGGPPDYDFLGTQTYAVAGSSAYPASWLSAPFGADGRELSDGYWDAWSFNGGAIAPPMAAVPEPTAWLLAAFSGIFFLFAQRRRRSVVKP